MNKTIQHLAEICRQYRFKEKLLFVPSYSIGHQLVEHLAKAEGSWINLRVTTIGGYAQELVALELSKDGRRLINSQERMLVIENLFHNNGELSSPKHYFRGAQEIPGLLKYLSNAIVELRMAGLDPGKISANDFVSGVKGQEIQKLLSSYEKFLVQNRLIDHAGVIGMAIWKLENVGEVFQNRVNMILSDFALTKIEKKLVSLVSQKNLVVIKHSVPTDMKFPKRFFGFSPRQGEETPQPQSNIDLLQHLSVPEEAPLSFTDDSVSLFHALGESNEVRETFRRIITEGLSLDTVEIVVTRTEPYISLIYEISSSLDLPVTLAGGVPIASTRPGMALLMYLRWQAEDFPACYLCRLFSGGYLEMEGLGEDLERPSFGKAAAVLREAGIGWGRDRYPRCLKALEESYLEKAQEKREEGEEEKAGWAERAAKNVTWVSRAVEQVVETVPFTSPQEPATLELVCKGAVDFLKRFCRVTNELDGAAKNKLLETLESFSQSPSVQEAAKETTERITKLIGELSVGHSNPKPGYVHVAHYRTGGYTGRTNTFVLGLDQARFPGQLLQDPILLDRERQALGCDLVPSEEILQESLYSMAKMLASLRGRVTLSYSCRDLLEDRELLPSSVLLGVYRLISGARHGDYSDLREFLGQPAGFAPMKGIVPLNDWEWWLAQEVQKCGSDPVLASYPMLAAGDTGQKERDKEELTEHDGWVPSYRERFDLQACGYGLSCSRLETLAKCPFAFFVRHVLGIEPLEELERDAGRWLDPLQRGELLHDVFCRFMEELRGKGELPQLKRHLEVLETIAMEEVKRWRVQIPSASELTFNRELKDIRQTLAIFLRDEEERAERAEPLYFELSFGSELGKRCGTVEEEPVEITLKGERGFKLRGRIDRVDRCGKHEYEVWDYKTGSAYGYKEEGYLNRGLHLQHALYALAAEVILRRKGDKKARVIRAGYFFPSPKGEGRRIEKLQINRTELYDVLDDLLKLLETGVFPATYDKNACTYCDYIEICGDTEAAVSRAQEKMEADKKMAPLGRLKEHA